MDEIRTLLLRLIDRIDALEDRIGPADKDADSRPNFRRVVEALQSRPGAWLSSGELARAAGIGTSSVRMILYTHRETFESERVSPGRVRWRLSAKQRFGAELEPKVAQLEEFAMS